MTNTELLAKIKAEIERNKQAIRVLNEHTAPEQMSKTCAIFQYSDAILSALLTFIDTLESEKPTNSVDVEREEIIGLSIMFFLGTHVKHENSVLVRGKGEVTYKEACEWIRRNIAREKSEEPMQEELGEEISGMYQALFGTDVINRKEMLYLDTFEAIARHFAQWGAEHAKNEEEL